MLTEIHILLQENIVMLTEIHILLYFLLLFP